jgi:EmrB/QacA subfamily drug resistance transporter
VNPIASGKWVLAAAVLGSSMAFVDATAVNVALPLIQRDFAATSEQLQWTVEIYALFLSAFMLIGGAFGDRFGRRRVFALGIAGFAIASLVCALSPNMLCLNIARAVQGFSAAMFTPGSLALISAAFEGEERGKAIGTWSGFASITGAVGPLLGGWLAQYASWRDVFLLNIPFALVVLWIVWRRIPESRNIEAEQRTDVVGAVLICVSLGGMTYALLGGQGSTVAWRQLAYFIGSLALFVIFLIWESRTNHPMMPLSTFRNGTFALLNGFTFLLYAALGGSLFFVPFDLQNVQGYSPTASGGAMLPFILIMFATSRWSGGLSAKIGTQLPLVIGACIAGSGFLLYSRVGIGGSYWTTFFPAACMLGIGGTFFVAPLTTGVMSALDGKLAGMASGVNNTIARIAGLLAIAALGLLLGRTFYHNFDREISLRHISANAQNIVLRQRQSLPSGHMPSGLSGEDALVVGSEIRASYAAGFQTVMIYSAGLSFLAGIFAMICKPDNFQQRKPE